MHQFDAHDAKMTDIITQHSESEILILHTLQMKKKQSCHKLHDTQVQNDKR